MTCPSHIFQWSLFSTHQDQYFTQSRAINHDTGIPVEILVESSSGSRWNLVGIQKKDFNCWESRWDPDGIQAGSRWNFHRIQVKISPLLV